MTIWRYALFTMALAPGVAASQQPSLDPALDAAIPVVPLPVTPADLTTVDPLEISSSGLTLIDDLVGQINPDVGSPYGSDLLDVIPAGAFIERLSTPLALPSLQAPPVIAELSALAPDSARSVLASQCLVVDRSKRLDFGQINQYADQAETVLTITLRCPRGHEFRIVPQQGGANVGQGILAAKLIGESHSGTTVMRLTSDQIPLGTQSFKGTGALQQIPVLAELLIPANAPRPSSLALEGARLIVDFEPDAE